LNVELHTSGATFKLFQILGATGAAFPEAVDTILRSFNHKILGHRQPSIPYPLASEDLYKAAPDKMLDVIAAVVGEVSAGSVMSLAKALSRIRAVKARACRHSQVSEASGVRFAALNGSSARRRNGHTEVVRIAGGTINVDGASHRDEEPPWRRSCLNSMPSELKEAVFALPSPNCRVEASTRRKGPSNFSNVVHFLVAPAGAVSPLISIRTLSASVLIVDDIEQAATAILAAGAITRQCALLVHVAEDDIILVRRQRDTDLCVISVIPGPPWSPISLSSQWPVVAIFDRPRSI